MTHEIDLPEKVVKQLIQVFSGWPDIETVTIFGSRALGNAKSGSDIDLCFDGKILNRQQVSSLQNYLEEESLFPYFFDCVHFKSIENEYLRQHILEHGKLLWQRD